jgi:regulator of RNase E activity RraA
MNIDPTLSALADRLEQAYSGAVYDVLRARGHANCVLPNTLRPLDPGRKLAGVVYTVSGSRRDDLDAHHTLLSWTALLSKAPPASVVVCQPNDSTLAHMGELSSETLKYRGVRGYVVDGGCRDSEFILQLGFPVWCRYFTPVDVVGRWTAETFGEPIRIGEATVCSGDLLLADRDGVVVVPQAIAAEVVVAAVEEVMRTESKVRTAILQGVDPQEAYLRFGKF